MISSVRALSQRTSDRPLRIRRDLLGIGAAIIGLAVLSAAMLPLRGHMTVATPALVLVLPVLAGSIVGGRVAGVAAVALGFLVFDFIFIPPYYTLGITAGQDWVALGVYFVVMVIVARLVAHLRGAELEARHHEEFTRGLLDLSNSLISDRPLEEFLHLVTTTFLEAFEPRSVALLLPEQGALTVVATAGEPLSDAELAVILPQASGLQGPSAVHLSTGASAVVPLSTSAGPLGLIALQGADLRGYDSSLIQTYANQAALAIERAQLREQAVRTQLLEEVDRWRDALVGAVSHDLRTPLAVIKAAVSDLRDVDIDLEDVAREELLALIEEQSDRLARLVVNLLDMTRIRAGALTPRLETVSVSDLVVEALAALPFEIQDRTVTKFDPPGPLVVGDHVLLARVLANLLENADRHGPPGTPIEIEACRLGGEVEVSVIDHGPGVAPEERERIFDMYSHVNGAGRAGLGLAIARAFVEAHGGSIAVTNRSDGEARFSIRLQPADLSAK